MEKLPKVWPKKKMGRPNKLTPELQKTIVTYILLGAYVETAAKAAGLTKDTFYDWLHKGATQRKGIYKDFSDAVLKAMEEATLRDLNVIDKAAQKGDWKAAAWKLEKSRPREYGTKKIVRIENENTKDSSFGDTNISDYIANRMTEIEQVNERIVKEIENEEKKED